MVENMCFRFSQLTIPKSMAALLATGHFDMPSYKNGGPVNHIEESCSDSVPAQESISAGLLWVGTNLHLTADVKLWSSDKRFPTKVEVGCIVKLRFEPSH